MSNIFGYDLNDSATHRPWLRITDTQRAASLVVLAPGQFALTDTGKQYNGNGTTQLRDLPVVSGSGGISIVDNGDGTFTASGTSVADNGDGTFTIAA